MNGLQCDVSSPVQHTLTCFFSSTFTYIHTLMYTFHSLHAHSCPHTDTFSSVILYFHMPPQTCTLSQKTCPHSHCHVHRNTHPHTQKFSDSLTYSHAFVTHTLSQVHIATWTCSQSHTYRISFVAGSQSKTHTFSHMPFIESELKRSSLLVEEL